MNIEQIADQAILLTYSMPHGRACFAACREAGVAESEMAVTAEIVSTVVTNREINPPAISSKEKEMQAAIAALVPKHLSAIVDEIEAEAAKRGGNWGHKAIAAIHRGQPRSEHTSEANRRAAAEVAANIFRD